MARSKIRGGGNRCWGDDAIRRLHCQLSSDQLLLEDVEGGGLSYIAMTGRGACDTLACAGL
jgi:hypothetical protein